MIATILYLILGFGAPMPPQQPAPSSEWYLVDGGKHVKDTTPPGSCGVNITTGGSYCNLDR